MPEKSEDQERRESQIFDPDPTGEPPYQPQPRHRTHEVEKGETLKDIAVRFYDDESQWRRIFEANEGILDDPQDIYPGQELKIPELRREV